MPRPAAPYNFNYMPAAPPVPAGFHGFHPSGPLHGQVPTQAAGFVTYGEDGTMYDGAPGVHATYAQGAYNGSFGYAPQWTPDADEYYTETMNAPLDESQLVRTMTGGLDERSHTTHMAKEMLGRLKTMAKTHHLSAEEIHKRLNEE